MRSSLNGPQYSKETSLWKKIMVETDSGVFCYDLDEKERLLNKMERLKKRRIEESRQNPAKRKPRRKSVKRSKRQKAIGNNSSFNEQNGQNEMEIPLDISKKYILPSIEGYDQNSQFKQFINEMIDSSWTEYSRNSLFDYLYDMF